MYRSGRFDSDALSEVEELLITCCRRGWLILGDNSKRDMGVGIPNALMPKEGRTSKEG